MFNLLIKGGLIIDGAGNPGFYGAIGVSGDSIVILFPYPYNAIQAPATRYNPQQFSTGVEYVIINGKIVIEKG